MRDRAIQALHLLALDPVAEATGDSHSYGFRRERCTADAIARVSNLLSRDCSPRRVLEGDIRGCFDDLGHASLTRSRGGSDKLSNLVLLHPNCHMQLHATE
jgi:retron-type reverse transcriptase